MKRHMGIRQRNGIELLLPSAMRCNCVLDSHLPIVRAQVATMAWDAMVSLYERQPELCFSLEDFQVVELAGETV